MYIVLDIYYFWIINSFFLIIKIIKIIDKNLIIGERVYIIFHDFIIIIY